MLSFNFNRKLFVYAVLAFMAFTVIGTLSHEMGHIMVAKGLGYDTKLSYGSMSHYQKGYYEDKDVQKRKKLFEEHQQIDKYEDLPESVKQQIETLSERINKTFTYNKTDSFLVSIGGPAQTILTAILGLIMLWVRKSRLKTDFKTLDWLGVFMGLFALREVFNTVSAIVSTIFAGTETFTGDEFVISNYYLELNQWIVPIITALFGLLIALYIIFKVIPLRYRLTFILSGLVGGVTGFAIWFGFLGKLLFPEFIEVF